MDKLQRVDRVPPSFLSSFDKSKGELAPKNSQALRDFDRLPIGGALVARTKAETRIVTALVGLFYRNDASGCVSQRILTIDGLECKALLKKAELPKSFREKYAGELF